MQMNLGFLFPLSGGFDQNDDDSTTRRRIHGCYIIASVHGFSVSMDKTVKWGPANLATIAAGSPFTEKSAPSCARMVDENTARTCVRLWPKE